MAEQTQQEREALDTLEADEIFEHAAETFKLMAAPMRLKIIRALCSGERNVSELIQEIRTTQSNMSQHLNTLYKAGVLARRRDGVQIFYRIADQGVVALCRTMITQIAIGSEEGTKVPHDSAS